MGSVCGAVSGRDATGVSVAKDGASASPAPDTASASSKVLPGGRSDAEKVAAPMTDEMMEAMADDDLWNNIRSTQPPQGADGEVVGSTSSQRRSLKTLDEFALPAIEKRPSLGGIGSEKVGGGNDDFLPVRQLSERLSLAIADKPANYGGAVDGKVGGGEDIIDLSLKMEKQLSQRLSLAIADMPANHGGAVDGEASASQDYDLYDDMNPFELEQPAKKVSVKRMSEIIRGMVPLASAEKRSAASLTPSESSASGDESDDPNKNLGTSRRRSSLADELKEAESAKAAETTEASSAA